MEGRGRERPRENEQHKKDIRKVFWHDPPFLLPPSVLPAPREVLSRQGHHPPLCAHSPLGQQLPGPCHSAPSSSSLLMLSGPPWMQRHQFLSVSTMHRAGTQLPPDIKVMAVAQKGLAWEGFWRGRLASQEGDCR